MVLLCKTKALYVKACVIANGITDTQGDTLYKDDIKKIFSTFNNQNNFEIHHNDLPIQEVSLLENYISTADETIGTSIVPSGSWNVVIRVDNPTIQEGLLTGEFGGISLNNRIAPKCSEGLSGQVRYQDIPDAECVIPLLISFVEKGANGYGLHVMDYDAYIKKSDSYKEGAKTMAFNLLEGLKSLLEKAEASEKEDAVILKEDNIDQEEVESDSIEEDASTIEADSETTNTVEEPVVQKADTTEEEEETTPAEEEVVEETEEKAEIEKADEPSIADLEARIAKLEELITQLLPDEEETMEEEEVVEEDTPKITKSEKVIVENNTTQENTNFYEMTGRDPLTGIKIRQESKIL